MIRRIFFLLSVLLIATAFDTHPIAAQPLVDPRIQKVTLYYNSSWELTTQEKAVFHRVTSIDLENIEFDGSVKDYTADGKIIAEGFYAHGVNMGLHTEYFDNGLPESTIEYGDDGFIIWEMTDQTNIHTVAKGTGKFTLEYYYVLNTDQGLVLKEGSLEGEFLAGKRMGTWIYTDKGGIKTDEETYEGGKFLRRYSVQDASKTLHTDKKTIIISLAWLLAESFGYDTKDFTSLNDYFEKYIPPPYNEAFNRPIAYPGGLKKLLLLIATGYEVGLDEMINGVITVDEHGKVTKAKIEGVLFNWQLGEEFKRVLGLHQLRILPAIHNGKPFNCVMKIPVFNSPEWIEYLQTAPDDDVNATIDERNQAKK